MKKIFLISILAVNLSYSQINNMSFSKNDIENDTILYAKTNSKLTDHSISLEKKFSFNQFMFDSKWDDLYTFFDLHEDSESNRYNHYLFEEKKNNIFRYRKNNQFDSFTFDDIFLCLKEPALFTKECNSSLVFCKSFNDKEPAYNFFLRLVNKYFDTKIEKNQKNYYSYGKKLNFNIQIIENDVYLIIEDKNKDYQNSLMYSYDYYNLYSQFYEIDNDYSYRGIKFGTSLSTIKSITKLNNYRYGDRYVYLPQGDKYLSWKGFEVEDNHCFFYFTKDYRLAEVSIAVDCFSDTDFDEIKNQLIYKFGHYSYERFDQLFWVGKNLTIIMPTKKNDFDYIHIYISSNKLKKEVDKDY
jgi:hypothetical protein